jgi:hypothetical protein
MQGYIKIHRSIMQWEWYKDIPVRILFEHMLLKANHKLQKWQGKVIEAGSFITSLDNLAFETGLSKMQVRTAIKKLISTCEITHNGHSKYSIITINNWNKYQDNNTQDNTQITHKQHTNNTQITPNKNDKNDNNDNNEEEVEEEKKKIACNFYGEFSNVYLSQENYDKLEAFILNKAVLAELIEELSAKISKKSDRYKPYDENFPNAHYLYLKDFWEFRKNNPAKFMTVSDTGGDYSNKIESMMKYLQAKDKNK